MDILIKNQHASVGKERRNCSLFESLLTEGMVDDLKQSKVASSYTVHAKLHDHGLEREEQMERECNKEQEHMDERMCVFTW